MKLRVTAILFVVLVVVSAHAAPRDDNPAWVQQAAAIKVPTYEKDITAVVLVDDSVTTVESEGKVTEVYNYAVRILRREGRDYAAGRVGYIPDIGKVKELKAWLVKPTGEIKR